MANPFPLPCLDFWFSLPCSHRNYWFLIILGHRILNIYLRHLSVKVSVALFIALKSHSHRARWTWHFFQISIVLFYTQLKWFPYWSQLGKDTLFLLQFTVYIHIGSSITQHYTTQAAKLLHSFHFFPLPQLMSVLLYCSIYDPWFFFVNLQVYILNFPSQIFETAGRSHLQSLNLPISCAYSILIPSTSGHNLPRCVFSSLSQKEAERTDISCHYKRK